MKIVKRILFYSLSFTWGIVLSLPGLFVIAFSACFKKVHVFHGRLYAVWGENWGGFNLGCFFLCSKRAFEEDEYGIHTRAHECGHGIQNIIFGPLTVFIVTIPSIIRYWYRESVYRKNPQAYYELPEYDAIWFEGQASCWGMKYILTDRI